MHYKVIDVVTSSPYNRSILTVQQLAKQIGQEVLVFEDLKERIFIAEEERMSDKELLSIVLSSITKGAPRIIEDFPTSVQPFREKRTEIS